MALVDKNMENVKFAEWLAENHYRLCDLSNGVYTWSNEINKKTSDELYVMFLNPENHYRKCL